MDDMSDPKKEPVRLPLPLYLSPERPRKKELQNADTDEPDSVFLEEDKKSSAEKRFYEYAWRLRESSNSSNISNTSPPSNFWSLPTETTDETEHEEEISELEKVLTPDQKAAAVALLRLKDIVKDKPEAVKLVENLHKVLTPKPKKLPTALVAPLCSPRTPSLLPQAKKSPVPSPAGVKSAAAESKIPRPNFLIVPSPSPGRQEASELEKPGRTAPKRWHSSSTPTGGVKTVDNVRTSDRKSPGPLRDKNVSHLKPISLIGKFRSRTGSAGGGKENRC